MWALALGASQEKEGLLETPHTVSRVSVESANEASRPSVEKAVQPAAVMGAVCALRTRLAPRCLWPRGRDLDGRAPGLPGACTLVPPALGGDSRCLMCGTNS